MGIEIEHKYLVNTDLLPTLKEGTKIIQAYLPSDSLIKTRIRVTSHYNYKKAYITVKGETVNGVRPEYEYEIPAVDGLELIQLCDNRISKTRYIIPYKNHNWELDIFDAANEGLVIAELEFDEIGELYYIPEWATEDVTSDKRYSNSNLITHPFLTW